MRLALAGNQNSGKTTLFNLLTGSTQHVGNWPGVTVEKKEGRILKAREVILTDLPGVYSLSPYTAEEIVSRDYLLSPEVDGIINIVDASNLERNLYLSLQLMELGKPMVIALNMMDEVRKQGDIIDIDRLEDELGVPVIPISARKAEGADRLVHAALHTVEKKKIPPVRDICEGELHESLHSIGHLVERQALAHGYPKRFAATKLMEKDALMEQKLELTPDELHIVNEIASLMEVRTGTERDAALADARYRHIESIVHNTVRRATREHGGTLSNRVDRVLTHRIWALPCFLGIMFTVFGITFGPLGTWLSDGFSTLLQTAVDGIAAGLVALEVPQWAGSLIVDGALGGVTAMLGFLPVILLLFFFLSVLEDTGYMARAAFVMDTLFRRFGLSGQCFIPMIMGFGCTVPAVMAARTIRDPKQRRLTIFVVPFLSCGAKIPVYALFISAFFSSGAAFAMMGLYIFGILVAFLCAYLLKDSKSFKADSSPFVMELPPYRLPTAKTVLRLLLDKGGDFVKRAFTVIFIASVCIWFLSSFNLSLDMVEERSESILAAVGGLLAPLFAPLGFGTWQASTAILAGFTAKEAVVSTMAVLYNVSEDLLPALLRGVFTPASALSFLTFIVLYLPCVAAFATMRRELGGFKWALLGVGFETGVAWVFSFVIFQIANLFW